MRRRRRPQREIAFSFDSFLDVVANVVGVILRLILVAWVGARAYKATMPKPPPLPAVMAELEPLPEPTDPREPLLAQRRNQLRQTREEAERDGELATVVETARQLQADLTVLKAKRESLAADEKNTRTATSQRATSARQANLSVTELQERSRKLNAEIEKLRQMPAPRKELRYRTPVSAPVQTEELMFECLHGKVTLIDHGAMLAEVKREVRAKEEQLRTAWEVNILTTPVGAFRLRYVIERERGALDRPGIAPSGGSYRYGVTGWEVVPVRSERGETLEQALKAGSEFRSILDSIDPQQTAVTFWVYPDSFALYRKLRDSLHEKEIVVAGRPLMEGMPIASSRHGTTSRGQ